MKRAVIIMLVVAGATMAGCGDPIDRMLSDPEQRHELTHRIAARPDATTETVDTMLETDSSRSLALDRILANTQARQDLLARVATDRTLMDGAINFAAQDSSMRDHVMTLVKGMGMGGGR